MSLRRGVLAVAVAGLTLTATPVAGAQPAPDDDIRRYPIAQGRYTTPGDFYWVYFATADGRFCGIGPNGGPVGCNAVPPEAPVGADQTVVNPWAPAEYRRSERPSQFTRDVDMLPEGFRVENWGATCAVEPRYAVRCETYAGHGFRLSPDSGELW